LRADGAADNLGGVRALALKLGVPFTGRYLYPCSDAAPQAERMASLREHGIELAPVVFYENRETPVCELPRLPFDRVLFTSTSTVQAYFRRYPLELERARTWLAVGPSTLKALQDVNLDGESLREGIVPA
jgi:uroporphyrinogen-III synthase